MKVDALSLLAGKKTPPTKGTKVAPGFDAMLRGAEAKGEEKKPADEKKPRSIAGTEEALLVARTLHAPTRPAPLIVTKQPDLKAAAPKVAAQPKPPVTVDQLASRAKVQHEPMRVTAPAEKKQPARAETFELPDKKRSDDPLPTTTQNAAPPPPAMETFRLDAPAPVKEAQPLAPVAPLLLDDASARVVLLPTVARMSVDTGDAGLLNVQLKVRDGVTELTATGPAAPLLEARQGELRVALAKEGLALGHFDLTQQGSQHRHAERHDPEAAVTPNTVRRTTTSSSDVATEDGRVHVRA